MAKRTFLILPWLLVLILGGVILLGHKLPAPLSTAQPTATLFDTSLPRAEPGGGTFLVTRVIDGDTIELETGQRVRYTGIDAPEPGECMGDLAADKNKELVLRKNVWLEKDISETDRYGRLLRYVRVDDLLVNEELVKAGFAKVSTFPPDVKHTDRFLSAQREAHAAGRGLWDPDACSVRGAEAVNELQSYGITKSECNIKGNINTKDEKIYHLPGCGSYEKTVINEEKGERWFCSEEEAGFYGWRKAKNCP